MTIIKKQSRMLKKSLLQAKTSAEAGSLASLRRNDRSSNQSVQTASNRAKRRYNEEHEPSYTIRPRSLDVRMTCSPVTRDTLPQTCVYLRSCVAIWYKLPVLNLGLELNRGLNFRDVKIKHHVNCINFYTNNHLVKKLRRSQKLN